MRGRPLKDDPQDGGARRGFEFTTLGSAPVAAPRLPGAKSFSRETRAWYREWCRSEQASQFISTDWLTLHMLAPLVDSYYSEPTPAKLAEIRQAHAKLGATIDDRMRLRLRVESRGEKPMGDAPAAEEPAARPKAASKDPRLRIVSG